MQSVVFLPETSRPHSPFCPTLAALVGPVTPAAPFVAAPLVVLTSALPVGAPLVEAPAGEPVAAAAPFGEPVAAAAPFGEPVAAAPFGEPVAAAPFGEPVAAAPFGEPVAAVAPFGEPVAVADADAPPVEFAVEFAKAADGVAKTKAESAAVDRSNANTRFMSFLRGIGLQNKPKPVSKQGSRWPACEAR